MARLTTCFANSPRTLCMLELQAPARHEGSRTQSDHSGTDVEKNSSAPLVTGARMERTRNTLLSLRAAQPKLLWMRFQANLQCT